MTTGSCGRVTFMVSAMALATISMRPMLRQGPKLSTGGMPRASHTAFKPGPAQSLAPGEQNPQLARPPVVQPADRTRMSR